MSLGSLWQRAPHSVASQLCRHLWGLPFPWRGRGTWIRTWCFWFAWARGDIGVRPFPTLFLAVQGLGDSHDSGLCH